jgi:PAS domain S-box-containing protein
MLRTGEPPDLHREEVLGAIAFIAERLLVAGEWQGALTDVLTRLGVTLDVSRVWLGRTVQSDLGAASAQLEAEWYAQDASPVSDGSHEASRDGRRGTTLMDMDEAVVADVGGLPEPERAELASGGIVSFVRFPVRVDGAWWGCIGVEDHDRPHRWAPDELDGLRAVAAILGGAIARTIQDERLRSAEQSYRSVIEEIPAVTYLDIVEPNAVRIGSMSPQIETLLGHPPERFLNDPDFWFGLIHPDDVAAVDTEAREAGRLGIAFDREYRMRHADGHWVWIHDVSKPVRDDHGTLRHFQGFMIDVTERKLAEEGLREAEHRYRVMVEHIPAVAYVDEPTDSDGGESARVAFISPQVEAMLGYTPDRFIDDPRFWFEIMHPDDLTRLQSVDAFSVHDLETFVEEYRMRHADGHWVWVHDTSSTVYDDDGRVVSFQGFMTDVTARHEAEERLRQAEERYRAIVEHTPAITYQELPWAGPYDADSVLTYVSPQIETVLGYTAAEWSASHMWSNAMHPDDLPSVLAEGARTSRTGEPYRQDYRMVARDGRIVWFHDEAHLIRDERGEPLFWQGVMVDITERKDTEDQLRQAQERLQALIDHIPAVVYLETPDAAADHFYISPQVERVFGYTATEWAYTPDFWIDRVHPDDRERVGAVDGRSDEERRSFTCDYRFLRADGTYIWVHDEAMFVPMSDGSGFWQGFLFDITERKEAEEQLAAAERVLRATVEHLPAIVYREAPDASPEHFYISPQVETIFGYAADEWRSTPGFWRERVHPDDAEYAVALNAEANATKLPFSSEYRFRDANGDYRWVHDEATYVPDDDGDGWWQGFLMDITARKAAERQLLEAEETFRTIVEQNPAVIYTQESEGSGASISRTTYISPRSPEVLGYEVEEITRDPSLWNRMVHPDDRERVLAVDGDVQDSERSSREYRMIAKDGSIIWVQDDAQLVKVDGRAPFWQGFLLDITERKHAEEQLERALTVEREATRRLRALDDMKNTFLQAVSHDLRTPLAAILGLAITLERGDVHLAEDDARDLARRIAGNARRLDRLVVNLLDMDRLARGIVAPKLAPTDVGALVRRVVAESDLIASSRLRTEIGSVTVPVDASKVERIVENLLANTARHAPPDATIWVSVLGTAEGCLVVVDDDGPGVPEELRDVIFEPFRQGPDAPQHAPGVGVGLTLVRRLAELHGGRAWVEERDGGGASFRVVLPSNPKLQIRLEDDRTS